MMGGTGRSKNIIDLLADSEALKAAIDSHNKATEARLKSAEDHRKSKAEALETLEQLRKKKVEHDVRNAGLDQVKQHLDSVAASLNYRETELNQRHEELTQAQAKLQHQNIEQQQILKKMTDDVLAKDERANQKHKDLDQKLLAADKLGEELRQREISVARREALLQDVALKLKG